MSKLAMTGKGFMVRVCSTYCMRAEEVGRASRNVISHVTIISLD